MSQTVDSTKDDFRDKVSTIDKTGKRVWIYPKKSHGPLTRSRGIVAIVLLSFLFLAPFLRVNDQPLLLFNFLERKFIIFGLLFWPQDFHIFVLATIAMVVFIILFTAVFGRIWCGWACPQTIFMEMLFRKIEYWIEGDARKQIALKKAPWHAGKIIKKFLKHSIFYALSFIIGNIFLAYIIGSDKLIRIITDPPAQHLLGLSAMITFSAVFYFVFAFFREQVCTMVCPYGRLQGVLLDQNSIVVAYDFKRGEPRERFSRMKSRTNLGDCIDCHQCVEVCPTGIDIRNGTQLECINCTACIDACNAVMKKVNFPVGLIRYTSYNGILMDSKFKLNPRIIGYTVVLILLISSIFILVINRSPIETTILRTPGFLYQESHEGNISNLFNVKIINKTSQEIHLDLKLQAPQGRIQVVGGEIIVPDNGIAQSAFFVIISKEQIRDTNTPIYIAVYSGEELLEEVRTSFMAPDIKRKSDEN